MTEQNLNARDRVLLSDLAQLRFMSQNVLSIASAFGLMAGGSWIWAPYALILLLALADEWAGVDTTNNSYPATMLQNAMLMLNGPLLAVNRRSTPICS